MDEVGDMDGDVRTRRDMGLWLGTQGQGGT